MLKPQLHPDISGRRFAGGARRVPGRAALLFLAGVLLAPPGNAQAAASVESNPQLFAVMCALQAAGHDAEAAPAAAHPLRVQLRRELLRLDGPATRALRQFYRDHRAADPAATLSRYISFALVVGPPPKFEFTMRREELPPDVGWLEGFHDLLARFYEEAQIARLWARVQPAYEREIARLQPPVAQVVFTATGYLREVPRLRPGRAFSVYVEPLVAGGVNFRSYGDHYSLVLSPGGEAPEDDIRHAYLHYLLDPLPFRHPKVVDSVRPLHRFVSRAARMPPEYREDFNALLTECLVRAVELRLRKLPPARLATALEEVEADGYILVRAFLRGLEAFDKAEPAMSLFFPDLVGRMDLKAEARRLETVSFAAAPPAPGAAEKPGHSELEAWLREGEHLIALPDAAAATTTFERVLARYPGHPRALYGLAVGKLLLGDGQAAKEIFQQLISGAHLAAPPNPLVRAMSHIYLGRIHDVEGNRELALSEYRGALAVEGAPEMARQAALRGLDKKFEPVRSRKESEPQQP